MNNLRKRSFSDHLNDSLMKDKKDYSSLSYPLEILARHLVNEEEYINYGIEQHPSSKAAFEESNRLAYERIPQLRGAIKILLYYMDELSKQPNEKK